MTDVPIEHHPTIRYMVYNGYYKVMSNIPKMGQLPTPGKPPMILFGYGNHPFGGAGFRNHSIMIL